MEDKEVFVGIDGDSIGDLVQEVLEYDNVELAKIISLTIKSAQDAVIDIIEMFGGEVIFQGGDNTFAKMKYDMDIFESMIKAYKEVSGHTATVGVGNTPKESHRAMVVGKEVLGKGLVVVYNDAVENAYQKLVQERSIKE